MHHKKQQHSKNIPLCLEAINGTCRFGSNNCWFDHNQTEIRNQNKILTMSNDENQDIMQKILDMMENCTTRIVQIENII